MNERFASMIECACRDFETLQAMLVGTIGLVAADGHPIFREQAGVTMALAKSFVFHMVRARRILEQEKASLPEIESQLRREFMRATVALVRVRDVNEHGWEAKSNKKPSLHAQGGGLLDETAMYLGGPRDILMGPLNLADLYPLADRLRRLAGYASLPRRYPVVRPQTAKAENP